MHHDNKTSPLVILSVSMVTLVLAMLRIYGMTSGSYQAIAHCWAGGLVGAWFVGCQRWVKINAVAIIAVEIAMFLIGLMRR